MTLNAIPTNETEMSMIHLRKITDGIAVGLGLARLGGARKGAVGQGVVRLGSRDSQKEGAYAREDRL
jgi:hypothetical protein